MKPIYLAGSAQPLLGIIHHWDVSTFRRFTRLTARKLITRIARLASKSGDGHLYPLIGLLALLVDPDGSIAFLTLTALALACERAIYFIAKNVFKRKRPANILPQYRSAIVASDEFSFPSGHSSAAALMATLLVLFYGAAFSVLYFWVAAVAMSRVLLGVHFPSDIIVGSLMGATIAVCCWVLMQ